MQMHEICTHTVNKYLFLHILKHTGTQILQVDFDKQQC